MTNIIKFPVKLQISEAVKQAVMTAFICVDICGEDLEDFPSSGKLDSVAAITINVESKLVIDKHSPVPEHVKGLIRISQECVSIGLISGAVNDDFIHIELTELGEQLLVEASAEFMTQAEGVDIEIDAGNPSHVS